MAIKVILRPRNADIEFDAATFDELLATFASSKDTLRKLFGEFASLDDESDAEEEPATTPQTEQGKRKRGRPPKNAEAPAPIPTPDQVVPVAAPVPTDNLEIPPFLRREQSPPIAPVPPPLPPAPPVGGVLGAKLIDELQKRVAGAADGGRAWAEYLAQSGLVIPGATFAECLTVIRTVDDAKLKPVCDQLGIA